MPKHGEVLTKWGHYRDLRGYTHSQVIPVMESLGLPEARKLKECGQFISVINCTSCHSKHFAGFSRCRNRFCLACNWQRGLLWVARVSARVEDLRDKYRFSFLTLTLKDCESLGDMIRRLEKAWRYICHDSKMWRKIFKLRIGGGIRSLEIKKGANSGLWHAHYHLLLAIPKGRFVKDYYWIKRAWKQATNGEGSVHIKDTSKGKLGMMKAILETVKYMLKPEKEIYELESFKEVWNISKGKRQINTFGVFRGLSKDIENDMETLETKKIADFVCRRCGCTVGELKNIMYSVLEKKEFLFDV